MSTIKRLKASMKAGDTLACCGLDPDLNRLPSEIIGSPTKRVRHFLAGAIDVVAPYVCAFKAQKAFFDALPGGTKLLAEVVQGIHSDYPNTPVFVDCKIGDTENTMKAYVDVIFEQIGADGLLVNPYVGDEVIEAFDAYADRAIIVCVRTSNPGAAIVQDALMDDGRPLWQYMLQLTTERWNGHGNMIPVISSTAGIDLAVTRLLIPDEMPILYAGVGVQGGDYGGLSSLLNSEKAGVFVNSSRGILYPSNPHNIPWQDAVADAAASFRDALNKAAGRE